MSNAKDLHNPIAHWISRLTKRRSPLEKDWALKSNYLLSNSCGKTQLSTQHSFPPFSNFIFWIRGLYSRKLLFVLSFLSYSRRASCYCSVTAPTALRPSGTTQNFKRKRKEKKQEKKQSSSFYLLAFPGRFFLGEKPAGNRINGIPGGWDSETLPRSVRPCRTSHADPDTAAFRLRSFHWWSWSWHGDYCNYMNSVVSCLPVCLTALIIMYRPVERFTELPTGMTAAFAAQFFLLSRLYIWN